MSHHNNLVQCEGCDMSKINDDVNEEGFCANCVDDREINRLEMIQEGRD